MNIRLWFRQEKLINIKYGVVEKIGMNVVLLFDCKQIEYILKCSIMFKTGNYYYILLYKMLSSK